MTYRVLTAAACTALLAASAAPAQQARYRDEVFPQFDVRRDVAYGSALNRFTNQVETLRLDLYEPRGDRATARPAVVVIHGGGFVGGDKGAGSIARVAQDLARRGYVTASINYRLAPNQQVPGFEQIITDAGHDAKAAVRYLRRFATPLRVDTERIGVLGSSAGGFTALEAGYVESEGNSGNPGFSSEVGGVVELWGALRTLQDIEADEAPLFIVHGTEDRVVAFSNAVDLRDRARAIGLDHVYAPIQGAAHAPWSQYFSSYHPRVVAFLYRHLELGEIAGLRARPGFASPGTLTLDSVGLASDVYFLNLALGTQELDLPGIGLSCLDPLTTIPVIAARLPATPQVALGTWTTRVPPGLAGVTLYWQTAVVRNREVRWLTNCVATPF